MHTKLSFELFENVLNILQNFIGVSFFYFCFTLRTWLSVCSVVATRLRLDREF